MSKQIFYFILLITFLLVSSACKHKNNSAVTFEKINNQKILVCDIDKISETREMKLSELVESVDVVRLENKPEAFVGLNWLRKISGDYLFFADVQNNLMLFHKNGTFINKWNSGRGPTEFIVPEHPEVLNDKVFVNDLKRGKLLQYSLSDESDKVFNLVKINGVNLVLQDYKVLSIGNSINKNDPYWVCLQNINSFVLQSVAATNHVALSSPLVQDRNMVHFYGKGLNIHFPTNDTLMYYDIEQNRMQPKAIFHSKLHIEANKKFYAEIIKNGLKETNKELSNAVFVIPEFETERYYFVSVHNYGGKKGMSWYGISRKTCLVDKKNLDVFYVEIINDFWGNTPFRLSGNPFNHWCKNMVQEFPAIKIKSKFTKLLEEKDNELDESTVNKIRELVNNTNDEDNSLVFIYNLK